MAEQHPTEIQSLAQSPLISGANVADANGTEPSTGGTFVNDLLASIVVFLVALPLCMGIAIASGVPPALGLITGIIGGIVVGSIAGSPLQVSGPAAGLTVLIYEIIQQHGFAMLGTIVLLAGVIQIALGAFKFGGWFRAIAPSVVQGMLAGIGVLIIASQIHVVVDDAPKGNGLENLASIPEAFVKGILPIDGSVHHLAAGVGLAAIAVMIAWNFVPKRLKIVPAPLVAVVVATGIAAVFNLPINYVSIDSNLFSAVTFPTFGTLTTAVTTSSILISVVAVALIASAETLLSATAVDQMHTGPRTRYNRELLAQGVGNTLCGMVGALPMTGVIVRSSANVSAGAKTRRSAIMHGVWILGSIVLLPFVLNSIPTTGLAAILVYTGFKLVSPKVIRNLAGFGRGEVLIYLVTVVAIVATNLLEGVLIGLALAIIKLLYTFSHLEVDLHPEPGDAHQMVLHLKGSATFIRLPQLAETLDKVPPGIELHVQMEDLNYIDHACLDLLSNWNKQQLTTGGSLIIEWDDLHRRYFEPPAVALSNNASDDTGSGSDVINNLKSTPNTQAVGAKAGS